MSEGQDAILYFLKDYFFIIPALALVEREYLRVCSWENRSNSNEDCKKTIIKFVKSLPLEFIPYGDNFEAEKVFYEYIHEEYFLSNLKNGLIEKLCDDFKKAGCSFAGWNISYVTVFDALEFDQYCPKLGKHKYVELSKARRDFYYEEAEKFLGYHKTLSYIKK